MNQKRWKQVIGRAEVVDLPGIGARGIPARIDTGARTSAIWASEISEQDGKISYVLFGKSSPLYTGDRLTADTFSVLVVASSNGQVEVRYKVPVTMRIAGRRIKTFCTLADRSTQAFPMLIGRNTLSGKFIVDVQLGSRALDKLDQDRYDKLQSQLQEG